MREREREERERERDRERERECNEKSEISLLSDFAIHFDFSDSFPNILRRLNFADRKFCETSPEKSNSTKIVKYNPSEN